MSSSFDRFDEKLEKLSDKIDENHSKTLEAIQAIELKVAGHTEKFNLLAYLVPGGSLLGVVAFFRDIFK